jgi:hypothetical protein
MIDEQINTFMASDQFRRRAAELESEIRADIALGKPVNLGDVGAVPGRAHARHVSALVRGLHHCAMARPWSRPMGAQ